MMKFPTSLILPFLCASVFLFIMAGIGDPPFQAACYISALALLWPPLMEMLSLHRPREISDHPEHSVARAKIACIDFKEMVFEELVMAGLITPGRILSLEYLSQIVVLDESDEDIEAHEPIKAALGRLRRKHALSKGQMRIMHKILYEHLKGYPRAFRVPSAHDIIAIKKRRQG